jgi:hypothetical protein
MAPPPPRFDHVKALAAFKSQACLSAVEHEELGRGDSAAPQAAEDNATDVARSDDHCERPSHAEFVSVPAASMPFRPALAAAWKGRASHRVHNSRVSVSGIQPALGRM